MATDNKIKFSIASFFTGEGFTKLSNSVKDVGKQAKQMSGPLNGLLSTAASAAKETGGAMGVLASNVGTVAQSFAQMGAAGAIIAGIKIGIDSLISSLNEYAEKQEREIENMNAELDAKKVNAYNAAMEQVKSTVENLKFALKADMEAFDHMVASANKMAAAVSKLADTDRAASISEVLINNFNEVVAAETASMKALIAARQNEALAIENTDAVREKADEAIAQARKAFEDAADANIKNMNRIAELNDALEESKEVVNQARKSFGKTSQEYTAALAKQKEIEGELREATKERMKRTEAVSLASVAVEQAVKEKTVKVNEATIAEMKAAEAVNEAEKAERRAQVEQEKKTLAVTAATISLEAQKDKLDALNGQIDKEKAELEKLVPTSEKAREARNRIADLENERERTEKDIQQADERLMDARIAAANEEDAQRLSLDKLTKANDKLAKEREKAAEQRAELESKQGQATQLRDNIANLEKRSAEIDEAHNDVQAEVAGGMAQDAARHQGISGKGYQYRLGANGVPDNFIDWQRAKRYADWRDRDNANRAHRDDAAQRRYQDLVDKEGRGGKLSDREKEWMDDFEQYALAKNKKPTDIVSGIIGAQKKTLSDLDKDITDLKTKLGLK